MTRAEGYAYFDQMLEHARQGRDAEAHRLSVLLLNEFPRQSHGESWVTHIHTHYVQ